MKINICKKDRISPYNLVGKKVIIYGTHKVIRKHYPSCNLTWNNNEVWLLDSYDCVNNSFFVVSIKHIGFNSDFNADIVIDNCEIVQEEV